MILVGTKNSTSRSAVEFSNLYPDKPVFASVGLHPIHTEASHHDKQELGDEGKEFTSRGEEFDSEQYEELLKDSKVVGIGECGLDYYHCSPETIEKQKKIFTEHVVLSKETGKPLMLHVRNLPAGRQVIHEGKILNAYHDVVEILKQHKGVKGDVHFFAGTVEDAKNFNDLGFMVSFTGVITFTHDYDEVVKSVPLDMIMADTDSPYVAPVPYRGKRNEPVYVSHIVKKIAEIKQLPEQEVAEAIVANAKRLFNLS